MNTILMNSFKEAITQTNTDFDPRAFLAQAKEISGLKAR